MITEHAAGSPATSLTRDRRGRLREGRMHLIPAPFTSAAGPVDWSRTVRTACGRDIVPGSTWAPAAWASGLHLARTHETGHCLRCVRAGE